MSFVFGFICMFILLVPYAPSLYCSTFVPFLNVRYSFVKALSSILFSPSIASLSDCPPCVNAAILISCLSPKFSAKALFTMLLIFNISSISRFLSWFFISVSMYLSCIVGSRQQIYVNSFISLLSIACPIP